MENYTPETKLPKESLRIFFEFDGDHVRIAKIKKVHTVSLPPEDHPPPQDASGFWYEIYDPNDKILYWRAVQNPIKFAVEVPTGDRERPLQWVETGEAQKSFILLIPNYDHAATLVLFSSPLRADLNAESAKELARFDLTASGERGRAT